jgi:hypothetical protein
MSVYARILRHLRMAGLFAAALAAVLSAFAGALVATSRRSSLRAAVATASA